jgi:hypothetical protein
MRMQNFTNSGKVGTVWIPVDVLSAITGLLQAKGTSFILKMFILHFDKFLTVILLHLPRSLNVVLVLLEPTPGTANFE